MKHPSLTGLPTKVFGSKNQSKTKTLSLSPLHRPERRKKLQDHPNTMLCYARITSKYFPSPIN